MFISFIFWLLYWLVFQKLACWTGWRGLWHHVVPRAPHLSEFFIWDGNKVTLVQHVIQRSVSVKQEALHSEDVSLFLLLMVKLWDNLTIQSVTLWDLSDFTGFSSHAWIMAHHDAHVLSSNDIILLKAIFTYFNLMLGLEDVSLTHHTTVGQVLEQSVGKDGRCQCCTSYFQMVKSRWELESYKDVTKMWVQRIQKN